MKFKVGDRVRIVRTGVPFLAGLQATVVSELREASNPTIGVWQGHFLDIDGYGEFGAWPGGVCIPPEDLEPISRPGLSAEDEKFVKDLQDALFAKLPDFNPKPRQGEIVQAGDA